METILHRILRKNNITIDPNKLHDLNYETPFFLFSKEKLVKNYHKFLKLFPNSTIHYAMKANSEEDVLKTLASEGSGFEVASMGELEMLKKIRVKPEKMVYGTSVKPGESIKEFYKYGVNRFAFDSPQELEKIAASAPGSKVYVRILANDAGSVFKFSEKFGTDIANVVPFMIHAKELGLIPYGISFHVGSQASNAMAWANTIDRLKPVFKELHELEIELEVLNLGGGYPCDYFGNESVPTLEEIAHDTLIAIKKLPYQPHLILEPGRGMVADTAMAIASVIARVERRNGSWVFLDLGVYNGMFETMAYQGSTRYPVSSLRPVSDAGETMFSIAGPTGDSPDVITREALLPNDIAVGDKVVFSNVGAYSLTTTSTFNGFLKPKSYMY